MRDKTALKIRGIGSERGRIVVMSAKWQFIGASEQWMRTVPMPPYGLHWNIGYNYPDPRQPNKYAFDKFGFLMVREHFTSTAGRWSMKFAEDTDGAGVPYWFLSLITVILPIRWFIVFRRMRRQLRPGLCRFCGYDLRASPQRCPECGKNVACS